MRSERIEFPDTPSSPLITTGREDGNCHYLVTKKFADGHASVTAIKLTPEDRLRRSKRTRRNTKKGEMDESTLKSSQRRATRNVREKCRQFRPDRMLTCTFKENLEELEKARRILHYFFKLCRHNWPSFTYVVVPERQKRGAVHFHLAIRGFYNVKIMRLFWRRAAGKYGGNVDITSPKKFGKNSWNPRNISQYLAKYLTKEDIVEFNSRRFSSGGEIPPVEKATGYVGIGLPIHRLADEILQALTGRITQFTWQGREYFGVQYFST